MAIDSTAQEATDLSAILPWYASSRRPGTGKALERVRQILPEIAEAERAGGWPPKLSRRARAILSKQPVAEAFARANERRRGDVGHRAADAGLLEDVRDVRGDRAHEAKLRGWTLLHAMRFGAFDDAA